MMRRAVYGAVKTLLTVSTLIAVVWVAGGGMEPSRPAPAVMVTP